MKLLNDDNFEASVNGSDKPVLVDFSAAWCGPCKVQEPVLEQFAEAHPEIEVVKVDIDTAPRTASNHGVQAIPTLLLFKGGQVKAQARGLQSLSRLEALVESVA